MPISQTSSSVKNSGVILGEMVGTRKEASPIKMMRAPHRQFRLEASANSIIVINYVSSTIYTFLCVYVMHKSSELLNISLLPGQNHCQPRRMIWLRIPFSPCDRKLEEKQESWNLSVFPIIRITIWCIVKARTLWRGERYWLCCDLRTVLGTLDMWSPIGWSPESVIPKLLSLAL